MNTIKELIYKYKAIYGWDILCSPLRRNLEFAKRIRGIVSEKDFLERCICNRMRHQQRLRQNAVDIAIKKLKEKWTVIESCPDFESLYDTIYNTIAKQSDTNTWISYCTVYDTYLRIGYSLRDSIMPDKYVYVHRHLIKNAIRLLGNGHIKDKCRIPRKDFVNKCGDFEQLSSLEIEDFLCLMDKLDCINLKNKNYETS